MTTPALLARDVAFIIRRNAAAYLAENVGKVVGDGHDRVSSARLAAAAYGDYAALLEIAERLDADDIANAVWKASRLDTVAREAIDPAAWNWLRERVVA